MKTEEDIIKSGLLIKMPTPEEGIISLTCKFPNTKWFSEEEINILIEEMIKDVEYAGYENPIDEAYHKALIDFEEALFGDKE